MKYGGSASYGAGQLGGLERTFHLNIYFIVSLSPACSHSTCMKYLICCCILCYVLYRAGYYELNTNKKNKLKISSILGFCRARGNI